MIASDQPTIFPDDVLVRLSSVNDGSMRSSDVAIPEHSKNFVTFIGGLSIQVEQTVYQGVQYEGQDYCRYMVAKDTDQATFPRPIFADGIATTSKGQSLCLPLADCTGLVLYDPLRKVLMVSHMGRHSTEQHGALRTVEFMQRQFQSDPSRLLAWLSPSPCGTAYPLWKRGGQSFSEANTSDLLGAGLLSKNIESSTIDTVTHPEYYSHSEFLKGNQATDGRYALVAMMRA